MKKQFKDWRYRHLDGVRDTKRAEAWHTEGVLSKHLAGIVTETRSLLILKKSDGMNKTLGNNCRS